MKNVGRGTLLGEVQQDSLTSPFKVIPSTGNSYSFSLGRGRTASFTVQFAPTQVGRVSQHLEIFSNDRVRPTVKVQVTGTGVLFRIRR